MRRQWRRWLLGLSAAAVAAALVGYAATWRGEAHEPELEIVRTTPPDSIPESALVGGDELLEAERGHGPPVPEAVASWTHEVSTRFAGHPQFHAVGLDEDGPGVTVWWHGDRPPELEELVGAAPVPVTVVPTPIDPGRLAAAAERLFADARLQVSLVGTRPDGTGLDVAVAETDGWDRVREWWGPDVEDLVAEIAGVPVTVSRESVVMFPG